MGLGGGRGGHPASAAGDVVGDVVAGGVGAAVAAVSAGAGRGDIAVDSRGERGRDHGDDEPSGGQERAVGASRVLLISESPGQGRDAGQGGADLQAADDQLDAPVAVDARPVAADRGKVPERARVHHPPGTRPDSLLLGWSGRVDRGGDGKRAPRGGRSARRPH